MSKLCKIIEYLFIFVDLYSYFSLVNRIYQLLWNSLISVFIEGPELIWCLTDGDVLKLFVWVGLEQALVVV